MLFWVANGSAFDFGRFGENGIVLVMLSSTDRVSWPRPGLVALWPQADRERRCSRMHLEAIAAADFQSCLQNKFYVDEFYEATIIRWNALVGELQRLARPTDLERRVQAVSRYAVVGLSWFNRGMDTNVVNAGFDAGCESAS